MDKYTHFILLLLGIAVSSFILGYILSPIYSVVAPVL